MSTTLDALVHAQRIHLIDQVMENERIARACGLRLTELQMLHLLVLHPDLRTSCALVRRTGLAHSSVGDAVERLVAAGFLTRERDEGDRRVVNLSPTERVREVAQHYAESPMSSRLTSALDGMDDGEITTVLRYFERLNALRADELG